MADRPTIAHDPPASTHAELLRQIHDLEASMRRHTASLALLNGALGTPTAVPNDGYDCEICGRPVPVEAMSGFAARNGAVVHCNCLNAQMSAQVPK